MVSFIFELISKSNLFTVFFDKKVIRLPLPVLNGFLISVFEFFAQRFPGDFVKQGRIFIIVLQVQ